MSWAGAEVEQAKQACARAEARLEAAEVFRKADAGRRSAQSEQEKAALSRSVEKTSSELTDYVASLVSELQEKDAAGRAAQQLVLDQLAEERSGEADATFEELLCCIPPSPPHNSRCCSSLSSVLTLLYAASAADCVHLQASTHHSRHSRSSLPTLAGRPRGWPGSNPTSLGR